MKTAQSFRHDSGATPASGAAGWKSLILLPALLLLESRSAFASNISAVWANDGGDKVTQDELRATRGTENLTGKVHNRSWDGRTIILYGAQNEVISFNLVLEAANNAASNVSI